MQFIFISFFTQTNKYYYLPKNVKQAAD